MKDPAPRPTIRDAAPADLGAVVRIERLSFADPWTVSALLSELVSDPEQTNLKMSQHEKDLFEIAGGRVLLLHLRGTLIFGVSRVITQQHSAIEHASVLIMDLSEVNHVGVSAALALEEVVLDTIRAGHEVYIVGAKDQPLARLADLGLKELIPDERLLANREAALRQASKVLSAKDREDGPKQQDAA